MVNRGQRAAPRRKPARRTKGSRAAAGWEKELTRPVETTDGKIFETLSQARDFVLTQPEKNEWHNAAGKLLQAAESGRWEDREEATKAQRNALFVDGLRLKL